ncbi:MAG: PepSY-associated TM helix domain-containing protein [Bacteroidales bacterium]
MNRAVHRDLGYFFMFMSIIYGISGIAMNHRHEWNPNYNITQQTHQLELPPQPMEDSKELSSFFLNQVDPKATYRTQLVQNNNLRIFVEHGSLNVDLLSGQAQYEIIRRRPVLYHFNQLHYNTPQKLWTWFSDAYALGLIILAVTGLFILKGKNGITRRGAWLTAAGVIVPLILIFLYFS